MKKRVYRTYYFKLDPRDGQLLAFVPDESGKGGLPLRLAVETTAKTLEVFGRREGAYRTLTEIAKYLDIAKLDAVDQRLRLAGHQQEVLGEMRNVCRLCGNCPSGEKRFWEELMAVLEREIKNPPESDLKLGEVES